MTTTTSHRGDQDIPWVTTLVIAMSIGMAAVAVYAFTQRSFGLFACGALVALASATAGALLGFIFGIPKTVASSSTTTDSTTTTTTAQYQGNSNLEQISDWLTKILVGAGLVQLGAIRDAFGRLGSLFDKYGCLGSCGWVVGPALVIAYAVCGFLLAYLWARIYMAKALLGGGTKGEATPANT